MSSIKKKEEKGVHLNSKRLEMRQKKGVTTPRVDKRIINVVVKKRRLQCRNIANILQDEEVNITPRKVNKKLFDTVLKAYRLRKNPQLTQAMMLSHFELAR